MKTPAALMKELKAKRLIPADAEPYDRYDHLEAAMLDALLNDPQVQRHGFTFDTECIDSVENYEGLLWKFLNAFPGDHGVESVSCRALGDPPEGALDYDVVCEVTRRGKKVRARWRQSSDYVEPEFLALAEKLTKAPEWRPVPVETRDQFYAQLFLEAPLARKLAAYRKKSVVSRESFLTRGDPSGRLDHIPILSEALYDEVLEALKARYLAPNGDWGNLADWRSGEALALCLTGSEDLIDCREGVPAVYPDIDLYLSKTKSLYQEVLLPDQECWYLGLADPKLKVIFEYSAQKIGDRVLDLVPRDNETEPHLIAAKDLSWVCHLDPHVRSPRMKGNIMGMNRLILDGDSAPKAARDLCSRLSEDRVYPIYAQAMERLEAYLSSRGFVRTDPAGFDREVGPVRYSVWLTHGHKQHSDPVRLEVLPALFLTEVKERFSEHFSFGIQLRWGPGEAGWPQDDSAENVWLITPESDAEQLGADMLCIIGAGVDWLEAERTPAELVEGLIGKGDHFGAAAVATVNPGAGDVERILTEGLAGARNQGARQWFVDQALKVFGINLKVE